MRPRMDLACASALAGVVVFGGLVGSTHAAGNAGLGADDGPVAMGVDASGNTYAVAQVWGDCRGAGGTDWDIEVTKHGPDGAPLWERRYDGPGHWCDTPTGIAVDAEGNAYVSAYVFKSPDPLGRFATHAGLIKFDSRGEVAWEVLHDPPAHHGAGLRDVGFDADGDIVAIGVVGSRQDGVPHEDLLTMKVSAQGRVLWARQWSSGASGAQGVEETAFIGTDAGRGVLAVATGLPAPAGGARETTLLRYSAEGSLSWGHVLRHPDAQPEGEAVTDDAGNLYLAGSCTTPAGRRALLVSLTPHGEERWSRVFEAAAGDRQLARSVRMGLDGLLYVGLERRPADGERELSVAVRDTEGRSLGEWVCGAGPGLDWFDGLPGRVAADPERAAGGADDDASAAREVLRLAHAWACGHLGADVDGDGSLTSADLRAFLGM